jgi:glutaconyl-CoA/methylmalonyl-CoA decarboxylase subunit delta
MIINEISFDFSRISSDGILIALIGYLVVFTALTLLFYVFNFLPKILQIKRRKKSIEEGKKVEEIENDPSGEVNAAIAMALYLYLNDVHDKESNVITIKRVTKTYSPWSSKIYNMGLRPKN